jgi:RNA polymerase sigma-70 factor (ECF subfamily)
LSDQGTELPGKVALRGRNLRDEDPDATDYSDSAKIRFARLVIPYLPDAYALARSITGNRADAEDVVQDSCLRAFRAIDKTIVANGRAWMLTIVHHTAYTWLRKNRPGAIVVVDDLESVEHDQSGTNRPEAETPETAIIAKAEGLQLEPAVQGLPVPLREVLLLRDIEGLSYREIAEVTDVPIGTVMSRLARARSRLMASIGKAAR